MTAVFIFLTLVLGLQVAMFFLIKKRRRRDKEQNVLLKYDIHSPADAFKRMNDMNIPEADRLEIERLYQQDTV